MASYNRRPAIVDRHANSGKPTARQIYGFAAWRFLATAPAIKAVWT